MKKAKLGGAARDGGGAGGASGRFSGQQYRADKGGARGDKLQKDARFEPFAYVALDATQMSGKHGAKAVGRFAGVMGSTSQAGRSAHKRREHATGTGAAAGAGGRFSGGKRKRG
jgi:hypothetical protein